MTAIERAEALLVAAESRCAACTCGAPLPQPCGPHCEYPYPDERQPACDGCVARVAVRAAVPSKAELLRGYIGAVKALVALMDDMDPYWKDGWSDEQRKLFAGLPCDMGRRAFADFERLFLEAPASAD